MCAHHPRGHRRDCCRGTGRLLRPQRRPEVPASQACPPYGSGLHFQAPCPRSLKPCFLGKGASAGGRPPGLGFKFRASAAGAPGPAAPRRAPPRPPLGHPDGPPAGHVEAAFPRPPQGDSGRSPGGPVRNTCRPIPRGRGYGHQATPGGGRGHGPGPAHCTPQAPPGRPEAPPPWLRVRLSAGPQAAHAPSAAGLGRPGRCWGRGPGGDGGVAAPPSPRAGAPASVRRSAGSSRGDVRADVGY